MNMLGMSMLIKLTMVNISMAATVYNNTLSVYDVNQKVKHPGSGHV